MDKQQPKILVLVEGEKTDIKIMNHLLCVYGTRDHHQIVSYQTNIYVLYKKMFVNDDPDSLDLLQVLKENEKLYIKLSHGRIFLSFEKPAGFRI